MFALYNILLHVACLASLPLWPLVLFSKRKFHRGFSERLGRYPAAMLAALAGRHPIWVHGASVGEVRSAVPLIEAIRAGSPEQAILLSTTTATGRDVARGSIPDLDGLVYFPLDLPWVVESALRRFDPSLIVLLETEIWPNFIRASCRRGVPVVVVSGRLSERSARRFRCFAGVFVRVLRDISGFGMQDREQAERLLSLGVDPSRVSITGSLKQARSALPKAPPALEAVTGHQGRPVVVIGSTHRGEEEFFVESLGSLRARFPTLLMVIAPRHPERFGEVETLLRSRRVRFRKRSQAGPMDLEDCEVLLLDTLGELFWIYGWASVVFMGGTMVDVGGHNLIEPCRWSRPILMGPHTYNVAGLAKALIDGGGAVQVCTKDELVEQLSSLLANEELAAAMGRRARTAAGSDRNVLTDTLAFVDRFTN